MSDDHSPTVKHLYESTLRRYETAPAVTFGAETLTYGELDDRSSRLASALVDHGLEREERVGLLLSNRPEYAVADIALGRAGLAKVPLNDMLAAADIEYMLNNSKASAVIVGPAFIEPIRTVASNVPAHVAFRVDDLAARLAQLRRAGVSLADEAPRQGAGGAEVAFLDGRAADGVRVELVERDTEMLLTE